MEFTIRLAGAGDAEGFLAFLDRFDAENRFMLIEPGERKANLEQQRKQFQTDPERAGKWIWLVETGGEIVGYLEAARGAYRRIAHRAGITMGVLQAFAGQGMGGALMNALDGWARQTGIRRLELSVLETNEKAVRLYRKMGFEIEGRKKQAFRIDGVFADGLYMAKVY